MTKTKKEPQKFGVKLPDGFNGSQHGTIDSLFEMTLSTIRTNKLYNGWTAELKRSPLGEWRYTITAAKDSE